MDKMFEKIIRMTQEDLFDAILRAFKGQKKICKKEKYLLIKGNAPIMLEAHLDTVHKEPVREICTSEDGNVIMSPQGIGGDDRCGVYALLQIWNNSEVKPFLLFTCDEEVGCIGAAEFASDYEDEKIKMRGLDKLKFIIEIDRKGSNDAVYYECDNGDFEEYITSKGFETQYGSCSDICETAPALGVAAVNLSSGYYNQHTLHEYIVVSELEETIRKVTDIVNESVGDSVPVFEWIETKISRYTNYGKYYGYDWRWNGWASYDDGVDYESKLATSMNENPDYPSYGDSEEVTLELAKSGVIGTNWEYVYRDLIDCGYSVDELNLYRQYEGDESLIELYEMEYGLTPVM